MNQDNRSKKLFEEFPPVTREQWESLIEKDLKGADRNQKLVWKSYEGFDVEPYFMADDLEKLPHCDSLPGEFPYIRGTKSGDNNWEIRQDIDVTNVKEANRIAVDAISRGADGIGLKVKHLSDPAEMAELLKGIDPEKTAIHFISSTSYPIILKLFIQELKARKIDLKKVRGSFNFDPINYYLLHDDFYNSWQDNLNEFAFLLAEAKKELPLFKMLTINGKTFHNCGSNTVQELGFTLASAVEYLSSLEALGIPVDELAGKMQFSMAIGSTYFMEIAKFRAFRMLWAKVMEAYGAKEEGSKKAYIHATTSLWNKSVFDPYVNVLRTTTEAMSGAIGGVDAITVNPFDITYKDSDTFSRRIARNQQIIIREESYLDKVVDPAAGSYYVEQLTDSLANAAWELFKKVEEKGGFLSALKQGFIREVIEESGKKRDMDIATRRRTVLGTNQYPNLNETMLNKFERTTYKNKGGLKMYRGTMAFEELRFATEKFVHDGNKRPSVFMIPMGNLAMRKARTMFTTNFFGIAGYEVIDNNGFTEINDGIQAAIDSKSEIVVICSSDEEYTEIVPVIAARLKAMNKNLIVIVAGNPVEHLEAFKNAGVDNYINLKTNVLDALKDYNSLLGI